MASAEFFQMGNYPALSRKTSEIIVKSIKSKKGKFSLALCGGSSVRGTLRELAKEKAVDWKRVNVFMADERLVSFSSRESNFGEAERILFSKIRGVKVFPFGRGDSLEEFNKKYVNLVKKLDLVVLGVGEDCHIASLFPNSRQLESAKRGYALIENAPKEPKKRVSLLPKEIASAKKVILLFASKSKRKAYEKFIDEKINACSCPAKIALKAGHASVVTVFLVK